ncbi:PilZ domain-containing protein [Marinimicrobium sp. C2-29]|uniref:PilZ domain-containing protein n=1 Tax=Marinimicrobium sp. C2-29 TaxID=3139825 RepID=UPI0031394A05
MSERRHYFRIDDYIDLQYRPVEPQTARDTPAENLFPDAAGLRVYSELKKIDSESAQLLYQIKDRDRQLADYLHLLNRKIDLLSQQLIAEPRQRQLPGKRREVNLSEGGLSFTTDEALEEGQRLALNLTFLPTFVGVAVYAQVARCEPCRTQQWEIAAEFTDVTDAQQQLISQQIMRAQMAEKRRHQETYQAREGDRRPTGASS